MQEEKKITIAIIGGGPSGLFMYKRLVESNLPHLSITVFERKAQLGAGMPYSTEGANEEHVTNVSDNEIPDMVNTMEDWITTLPEESLQRFGIEPASFNEYKVVPRLLFGDYLSAQFRLLQQAADKKGIHTDVCTNTAVVDMVDKPDENKVVVITERGDAAKFDYAVICTGHQWPKEHEGSIPNYFDSPYPPEKLEQHVDFPIAIRGASLTAVDAVRTLARQAGSFEKDNGNLLFHLNEASKGFKLVMHSRNGFLPAVRFHLEDSHLSKDAVLSDEEIAKARDANEGFVPLDFLFQRNFKDSFRGKDPEFYEEIKEMCIEEFVDAMIALRERLDPFLLLKAEYAEAEKSIKRKQSVYWKEALAVLSFAMNYPAKHLSAEDMLRLQKVLMPLISVVIAFVPQSSCRELMALHDAGLLSLVAVGDDSTVTPSENGGAVYRYKDEAGEEQAMHYKMFVDCIGQPHLPFEAFPFKSLAANSTISPARLRFRSVDRAKTLKTEGNEKVTQDKDGTWYLKVPGIAINDNFQVVDKYGAANGRIYAMAVPHIGGYNPDYSGLDFSEAASARILKSLVEENVWW